MPPPIGIGECAQIWRCRAGGGRQHGQWFWQRCCRQSWGFVCNGLHVDTILQGSEGPHSGHSGKLNCLMLPPFLSKQEYCQLCSLCSSLVTVTLIGKRARCRHCHLHSRIMATTLLGKHQFRQRCGLCSSCVAALLGELVGNGLCACCLVLATLLDQGLIAHEPFVFNKRQFCQRCGPCSSPVVALLSEFVGDGLRACCLLMAVSLNQRLIALSLFPVTVKILLSARIGQENLRRAAPVH